MLSPNFINNEFRYLFIYLFLLQLIQSEEWDIRYEDLQIAEKIGSGRVGTVYRGYWHADVAIRVIDINIGDEEKLKAFKQEV